MKLHSVKIFTDENISPKVVAFLRQYGLDILDTKEQQWHESTFSSVRLRTAKVRSCFSSTTVVTMAFKLCQSAQKRWQHLHRSERLAAVIEGVKFVNRTGIFQINIVTFLTS